ncbi:MAG: hypothetical protein HY646_06860 [Acidobacteria bacterium]|nr:hypothetical protein [Acidobacteriota bacterium]
MQLTSVMINISWFCDFHVNEKTSCSYCWVTMAQSNRSRSLDRPAEAWVEAIYKNLPATAVIDFVGGEPTIFPEFHWMLEQLSRSYRWAITSNMGAQRYKLYVEKPVRNCLNWTASYHHSSFDTIDEFAAKCKTVSAKYPLNVNVVDYPNYDATGSAEKLREKGLTVHVSPFEDVRDLNAAGPKPLTCNGGMAHVTIDPQGHVYKCLTQERRADKERWRLGNIFEGGIQWPSCRSACFIPCDQYYVLDRRHVAKDMWGLDVRELEVPEGVDLEPYRATFNAPPSARRDFIELSQWQGRNKEQARGDLIGFESLEKKDEHANSVSQLIF